MVFKLVAPEGCLLAATCCLLSLNILVAGGPARLAQFDWPANAESMLRSGIHLSDTSQYTEQQADDFLANALLRLSHLAQGSAPHNLGVYLDRLVSAGFLARHGLPTEGVDHSVASRRSVVRWFSLPLLSEPPAPNDVKYARVLLADGRLSRSLDLIRFDRFAPRANSGFWLPTAIVRPILTPSVTGQQQATLHFIVRYQFPTSPILFRSMFRQDQTQAWHNLEHVLQLKSDIWLAKLSGRDRYLIKNMWSRAYQSPLLPASPFFEPGETEAWRTIHGPSSFSAKVLESSTCANQARGEQPGSIALSSSHNTPIHLPTFTSWSQEQAGSSTGQASLLPSKSQIVEYNFLNSDMANKPDEASLSPHTRNREPDLSLDLTLAPPSSGVRKEA